MHCEVGAVAFVVDYGFFLAVFLAFARHHIANILSICAGIAVSFTLNTRYNFQRRDAVIKRVTKFVGVALFGMLGARAPANPVVPDNAPAETVVAAAIVEMSHSLPFTRTVTISGMNIVTACALTSADDTTHATIASHQGGQSLSARISV
jgi:hypothetical protein